MGQQKMLLGHVKGDPGPTGPAGKDSGFGTITATIDGDLGEPSVDASWDGDNTSKNLTLAFHNLKGEPGQTGPAGPAGSAGSNGKDGAPGAAGKDANIEAVNVTVNPGHSDEPSATAEVSGEAGNKTISFTFEGLQGAPGAAGEPGQAGKDGTPGAAGAAGKDANIASVDVTVNPGHSEAPSATATVSGDAGNKTISLTFSGLQGADGATGQAGPAGPAGQDFKPGGSATQLVLGDGTCATIASILQDNIETIRAALGVATTAHNGLMPQLPENPNAE